MLNCSHSGFLLVLYLQWQKSQSSNKRNSLRFLKETMHSYSFLNVEFQSILFSPPEIDDEKNSKSTQADVKAIVQQVGSLLIKHLDSNTFKIPKKHFFWDKYSMKKKSMFEELYSFYSHNITSVYWVLRTNTFYLVFLPSQLELFM